MLQSMGLQGLDMTKWLNSNKSSIINMYWIFFIHSSVNRHLGYLYVLAIVNSTAVNTGVHISFQTTVFSEYMPWIWMVGSCASSIFKFLRVLHKGRRSWMWVNSVSWYLTFQAGFSMLAKLTLYLKLSQVVFVEFSLKVGNSYAMSVNFICLQNCSPLLYHKDAL